MKSLSIINKPFFNQCIDKNILEILPPVNIEGTEINLGIVDIEKPYFDENKNENYVLLKVTAFSCNYRDKALIVKGALNKDYSNSPVTFFGSDFVGIVENIGKNVTEFKIGDRVIPNSSYPYTESSDSIPGVVTNEASKRWLIIHKDKLLKIPLQMSDEIAAGFTIGAQTSHSMIRKTNIKDNDSILILSGKSHTSLFIAKQLVEKNKDITILTTSNWSKKELEFVKPAKIIKIDKETPWDVLNLGSFDVIFDPFYDLHIQDSINILNPFGRYITCGFKNQHNSFKENTDKKLNSVHQLMTDIMINNLILIGNCIGTTEDLKEALNQTNINDCIPIDSIYKISDGSLFIDKTYNQKRFGKVIMKYQ